MRRLLIAVAVSAAALAGALPSDAATAPGCLTLHDPVGDAHAPSNALYQPPATPGVDVEVVSVRSDATRLTASITVGNILLQPPSLTTRYAFDFVLRGWDFSFFYEYNPAPDQVASQIYYTHGIEVFGEVVPSSLRAEVVGSTITFSVTHDELSRLRQKDISGQALGQIKVDVDTSYLPKNDVMWPHQTFDTVKAPAAAKTVLGGACRS